MSNTPEFTSNRFDGNVPKVNPALAPSAGYRVTDDRRVTLSKDLAEKMLTLAQVPGDRQLSDAKVEDLMKQMIQKTFLYEIHVIASAVCKEDGKEYRINSQHTCWAAFTLAADGVAVEHGKSRHIRYEADTLADVRALWGLYDRGGVRTKKDAVVAGLFGTEEFADVGKDTIKRVFAAFSFWQWDNSAERSRHDATEVVYLLQNRHLVLCQHVLRFSAAQGHFHTADMMPFRRAAVMGSMFETFDAAPQKAAEFWTAVCTGLNLSDKIDPRYKLRVGLQTSGVMTTNTSAKRRVDAEAMYRWGIFAWNAWRRGDTLQVLRAPTNTPRPRAVRRVGKVVDDTVAEG